MGFGLDFSRPEKEAQGSKWFETRGLPESQEPYRRYQRASWRTDAESRCSKLTVGVGRESLDIMSMSHQGTRNYIKNLNAAVPPYDHGWGGAFARVKIATGESVEVDTMIILPANITRGTMLAPLTFEYSHLNARQWKSLSDLRSRGSAGILYFPSGTSNSPGVDIWEDDNVALLPIGNIATVRRVGRWSWSANCEVDFAASESGSLEMHLRATRDIQKGEVLAIASPAGGSLADNYELARHITQLGQPIPAVWKDAIYNQRTLSSVGLEL